MSDFILTLSNKLINVEAIAFISSRENPRARQTKQAEKGATFVSYKVPEMPRQLVIAFSAAATGKTSAMPLSLIFEGEEAFDLIEAMEARGIDTGDLKKDFAPDDKKE